MVTSCAWSRSCPPPVGLLHKRKRRPHGALTHGEASGDGRWYEGELPVTRDHAAVVHKRRSAAPVGSSMAMAWFSDCQAVDFCLGLRGEQLLQLLHKQSSIIAGTEGCLFLSGKFICEGGRGFTVTALYFPIRCG